MTDHLTQHGVMLRWQSKGILLTGPPGIGKSSVALELLQLGAVLIADDVVDIHCIAQQLVAKCPPSITGKLYSREIGFLDIQKLFGSDAVQAESPLDAVVNLQSTHPIAVDIAGRQSEIKLLNHVIPKIDLCTLGPVTASTRITIWLKSLVAH